MDQLQLKIKDFFKQLSEKGIVIPFLRDPRTKTASVSLTMVVISFNIVLIGLIGKWSKQLGDINIDQAINWFLICSGLYFGRALTKSGNSGELKDKIEDITK